jgi:hypothetical protein
MNRISSVIFRVIKLKTIIGDYQMYDLELSNIPLINLRMNFHNLFLTICSNKFYDQVKDSSKPIELPLFIWGGMPDALFTLLLQQILTGAESYISGTIFTECGERGILNDEIMKKINNPFLLGGRSTANNFYNKLPSLADPKFELKNQNIGLWNQVVQFYKEIRNPIFHGNEVRGENIEGIYNSFVLVADIYEWVDSWHSIDNELYTGASELSDVKNKFRPQWTLLKTL